MKLLFNKSRILKRDIYQTVASIYLSYAGKQQEKLPSLKMQYLVDDYREYIEHIK